MKKRLFLVKWLVSGTSIISGFDETNIRQQFDNFEFEDLRSEIEKKEITKIEEYKNKNFA